MYYEEKIENGILYYRHLPDGEWHKADYDLLMRKIMALVGERSRLTARVAELEASPWRPASEPPDNLDEVLVIYQGTPLTGWYRKRERNWVVYGIGDINNITHWMPMPALPEDKG